MTLLEMIQSIAAAACPEYQFVFETSRMMNVEADDSPFPCVFMDEYYESGYAFRYGWKRTARLELSFMKLAEMQCDAVEREALRDQIRAEAVKPFLHKLEESGYFESIEVNGTAISSPNEPPRFDANAVSVFLRMTVTFRDCYVPTPAPTPTPDPEEEQQSEQESQEDE